MVDDHDLLIRLDSKMDMVLQSLDDGKKRFVEMDNRLDEEEKWTVRIKTGIGIIVFILTLLGVKIFYDF